MKKKIAVVMTCALAVSALLSGCQASKGLENEYVKIAQYKDVEIGEVSKPEEITDSDIDYAVSAKLQEYPLTDKKLQVKKGDVAIIDYVGKMDGKEFDGGSAQNTPLEIGSGTFIPGFEESVIDHHIGETFDWNGKFPDQYSSEDLAGKDVVFTITVNGIVPELTDDLVKEISETAKSVEEYRKELKEQLTKSREENYQSSLGEAAWNVVVTAAEVKKYPEDELSEKTEKIISQYKNVAETSGITYEEYIKQQTGLSVDDFKVQLENVVKENMKQTLVAKAIADKENMTLNDEEYKAKLDELAVRYNFGSAEEIEALASEDELREMIITEMVMEWLGQHCVQVADK